MDQQTMTAPMETIADQVKAGRHEEACQALDAIEETDENRCELLFLRGRICEARYDREAALTAYEKLLELKADHTEARFRAALLSDLLGDDDAAMAHYDQCLAQEPVPVNVLVNMALLYEERGELEEAERCLKSVLAEYPNHTRARCFLKSVESAYTMLYDERGQREHEHHSALLDTSIADFELSVRSRNCLRQMDIRTLGDLLSTTEAELLSYKNFGETSLNEIKAMLKQKGLSLGQGVQPADGPLLPIREVSRDSSAHLNKLLTELELSIRSRKCLQTLGLRLVGELVMCSETELMNAKNFGQTSLTEIKQQLAKYGLSFRA